MRNFIASECNGEDLTNLHDYVTSQVGKTIPAILTHLTERGLVSGEPYMMSNVNHRDLNTVYWHEQVDPSRPFTMIESLTKPNHSRRFDVGNNYMTLYFYEVTDQVNSITEEGTSLRTTRFVAKGKDASVYSFARDRVAMVLSGAGFRRLLAVFNYRWMEDELQPKADDAVPTSQDLVSFCELFRNIDVATVDGFKGFLHEFSLDTLFEVKDNWSITEVHYHFGLFLRSIVNVRIDVCDGQHRWLLIACFLTGFFSEKTPIPRVPVSWEQSDYKKFNITTTQMFYLMCINVAIVIDDPNMKTRPTTSIAHARNNLRIAGDIITQASNMNIPPTWSEIIQKLSQSFHVTSNCQDYTYANYWAKTKSKEATYPAFSTNMSNLKDSINALSSNDQQTRYLPLLMGKSEKSHKRFFKDLGTSLKKLELFTVIATPHATMMLEIIRACIHSTEARNKLRRYFLNNSCRSHPQRHVSTDIHRYLQLDWIRMNIYDPLKRVIDHVAKRIVIERYLIETLRSVKEDDPTGPYHQYVENGYKTTDSKLFVSLPNATELEKMDLASLKHRLFATKDTMYGANDLINMITFAFFSTILMDIFDTIWEFGFDPDFNVFASSITNRTREEIAMRKHIAQVRQVAYETIKQKFTANGDYKMESEKPWETICIQAYRRTPRNIDGTVPDPTERQYNQNKRYNFHYEVVNEVVKNLGSKEERDFYTNHMLKNGHLREYLKYVLSCRRNL